MKVEKRVETRVVAREERLTTREQQRRALRRWKEKKGSDEGAKRRRDWSVPKGEGTAREAREARERDVGVGNRRV